MEITVSIVIMQVTVSVVAMYVTCHKIDQKTFKGIISDLHFTSFVSILLKLRYLVGRNYKQVH